MSLDVRSIFERLGVDTNNLHLNDLDWYIKNQEALQNSEILLGGLASGLKAVVSNLVLTPHTTCVPATRVIDIKRAYLLLSDKGFEFNDSKFLSIHTRFVPPLDCRLTVYAARLDCKGANNLQSAYIAMEYVCSLLRDRVFKGRRDAFSLVDCTVTNLVVTCKFDFKLSVSTMQAKFPSSCTLKTPKDRKINRKGTAIFQGAVYLYFLKGSGRGVRILFQNQVWVICVGVKTYEEAKESLEHFYLMAFTTLPRVQQKCVRQRRMQLQAAGGGTEHLPLPGDV